MEKVAVVYGFGVSGKGASELLTELKYKIRVYCDEYKDTTPYENWCGKSISEVIEGASIVVLSPNVKLDSYLVIEAKAKNIEVIGEIELGYRNCKADVIAVTGTNGKTTTTLMIENMMQFCSINAIALGNIGESFSARVNELSKDDVAVVEVSSFQLESIELFEPKIAVILNISPDHIERHKIMENYIEAKKNIIKKQNSRDYAILNSDDELLKDFYNCGNGKKLFFSLTKEVEGAYCIDGNLYYKCNDSVEYICEINALRIKGEHNLANALACICVGKILKFPNYIIIKSIVKFINPPYRVQHIGNYNGVEYYNDSKSTNADSTGKALKGMSGSVCLIMGGYDKGLEYTEMFNEFIKCNLDTLILYGENRFKLFNQLPKYYNFKVLITDNLRLAVMISSSRKVENILFSPGTSSFDSFRSYVERGEYFNNTVRELYA